MDKGKWDYKNDFCNIHVDLDDGRHYGLNVWTYQFLQSSVNNDQANRTNLSGRYQIPPDLLVEILSRECIESVIADLLDKGDLEKVLNPSIIEKTRQS